MRKQSTDWWPIVFIIPILIVAIIGICIVF